MKPVLPTLFVSLLTCALTHIPTFAADHAFSLTVLRSGPIAAVTTDDPPSKKSPVFRATKEQITAAQNMLKSKGVYTGDATGKLDPATKSAIKAFQKENGLSATGGLNRATLEKLGIELTEKQKLIPAAPNQFASAKPSRSGPRTAPFRASKDQIIEAQRLLKSSGMYSGDETGKLDDATREGLKKYQEVKGLKVTGTLNQVTLEKMGIGLTDKQKTVAQDRGQ
jgi:peptidoglycan hydrolase-like protein with peptidoglycan-binding domain